MENFIKGRQNHLKKVPSDKINAAFFAIERFFTKKWLEDSKNKNTISVVWRRKDWLATNELYSLGSHLIHIENVDKGWLKMQVKNVKGKDENNSKGALFEIEALGYLLSSNKIIPAKSNQAGYDAILSHNEVVDFHISLKRFGLSAYHNRFKRDVQNFEAHLLGHLKYLKINKVQLFIDFPKKVPEKENWEKLREYIPDILKKFKNEGTRMYVFEDNSCVIILASLTEQEFSQSQISYSLTVSSVYHTNEEKNLISKIENACANIIKYSPETKEIRNVLFIHIPESASIKNCFDWTIKYLNDNTDIQVSSVIFYQPTLTQDISKGKQFIHHCFKIYHNDFFDSLTGNVFQFDIPVGIVTNEPSVNKIIADNKEVMSIDNRYIVQLGNHYIEARKQENGSYVGNIPFLGAGIKRHLIFSKPFDKQIQISAIAPPEDDLKLI